MKKKGEITNKILSQVAQCNLNILKNKQTQNMIIFSQKLSS